MKAWVKAQEPGYAGRVEQLLKQMNDAYEKQGIHALKPDVVSYGCAIDAWCRSGEPNAIFRAEGLLREMERLAEKGDATLRPNRYCYNCIINVHSKAGNAEKAESVLQWMEDSYLYGNRHAKPDVVSYTSCIDAWSRNQSTECDAVRNSQKLFVTMVDKYREGDMECKPSVATFSALMMVLANRHSPEVARYAKENLRVMQELDIQLNTIAFNALLYACSCATAGKGDALELAITSFNTMKNKHVIADSLTYNTLLHVVRNLVEGEDERQRALEDVLRKCQEDGKVNENIRATMARFGLPLLSGEVRSDGAGRES
jgi:pentatricopeptide repeat protein